MKNIHSISVTAIIMTAGVSTLTSCAYREGMCSSGEHPVYSIAYSDGGVCVADGDPPPDGFAEYPPERVPKSVGDRYDRWPLAADYPWRDEVEPDLIEARRGMPDCSTTGSVPRHRWVCEVSPLRVDGDRPG